MTTPEALADLFLEQADQLGQQMTPEAIAVLVARAEALTLRDAAEALRVANSAEFAATLINHPLSHASALTAKGAANTQLRQFRAALNAYQSAETIYAELNDQLQQVNVQSRSLFLHYFLGEREQAFALADSTRRACAALGPAANRPLARVDFSLGILYKQLGQYDDALAAYAGARKLLQALDETVEVARIDINCANIYQEMDRFAQAQQLYQQAQQQLEPFPDHRELIAHIESNLGLLAHRRGRYQEAIQRFESAENRLAQNPLLAAMAQLRRAIGYQQLGLIPETIALATQAASTFAENDVTHDHALALQTIGKAHLRQADFAAAQAALSQAQALYQQQDAQQDVAETGVALARLALANGDIAEAASLASNILDRIEPEQLPRLAAACRLLRAQATANQIDLEQALRLAEQYQLTDILAETQWRLAEAASSPAQAWQALQQAIGAVEQLRAQLWLDEFRLGFMDEQLDVYADAIAHALQHDHAPHEVAFLSDLAQSAPLVQSGPRGDIPAELRQLREQWHWHNGKLEAQFNQADRDALTTIEQQIAASSRRHLLQAGAEGERLAHEIDEAAAQAWAQRIQAQLAPNEALLHYILSGGSCYAIIITADGLQQAKLASTAHISGMLRGWRHHLGDVGLIGDHAEQALLFAKRFLVGLCDGLFAPVDGCFSAEITHLKLVLPPAWHDLPFAAFVHEGRYLAQRFSFSHLSAPSALLTRPSLTKQPASALLIGNSCDGMLPTSVVETEQIATALGAAWQTSRYVEAEATWASVQPRLAQASLIHCATHALFRPDNPLFSWLQLTDHRMTVAELYEQPLPLQPLVVLSACETGRGRARGGGLAGMGRAWLAAGARGLIVTGWRVEDQATARLMQLFYQRLAASDLSVQSIATTLQQAQCELIRAHPFFWAGFIFLEG